MGMEAGRQDHGEQSKTERFTLFELHLIGLWRTILNRWIFSLQSDFLILVV